MPMLFTTRKNISVRPTQPKPTVKTQPNIPSSRFSMHIAPNSFKSSCGCSK